MCNKAFRRILSLISIITASVTLAASMDITALAVTTSTAQRTTTRYVSRQYVVSKDGTGDYMTINEAVAIAQSGDTIIIYPGTYDEIVTITDKELNLVGISKDLCIIRSDSVSYRQSPLSIGAGSVSNLTIYGMYTGSNAARVLTYDEISAYDALLGGGDTWARQQYYKGYAVHIDQNYSYGKTLTFNNCKIVSENSHAVGIGTRGNSTISFNNCQIIGTGDGGCFYMHDSPLADVGGEAHLNITNSTLTSYLCPYIMTLESILPQTNTTYLTFQNVKASAVAYASDESYVSNNINTFFDVETLETLSNANLLSFAGFSTTAKTLVNHMDHKETTAYMNTVEEARKKGDATEVLSIKLEEGITYIGEIKDEEPLLKHQVIAAYNSTGVSGIGWCGLDSVYLTNDSFGNTLVEMNAVRMAVQ